MKYCPYCGTVLVDGAVSFCAECGKALPVSEKKQESPMKSNQSEQQGKSKLQQEIQHEKESRRRKKGEKEVDMSGEKKIRQPEPLQRPKQQSESPAVTSSVPEDDYDGYYDDILPADEGRYSEGIDRGLVKKIVLIIGMVLLIVGACVMMMYLL